MFILLFQLLISIRSNTLLSKFKKQKKSICELYNL